MAPLLLSVVESPTHPDCSELYRALGYRHQVVPSVRRAIAAVRREPPAVVVAEFFYGYGNNYAGVNLGNLDVLLASLERYAPGARTIAMVDKAEQAYAERLAARYPLHALLVHPVTASGIRPWLDP